MYFNHAFRKVFVGTHATAAQTYAGGGGTALTQAGIDKGFVTTTYSISGGPTRLKTVDLANVTDYGMGPGCFAMFNKDTYEIVQNADLSSQNCCPLILASASIRSHDKIGPFHGGYQESTKSKIINPKYIRKFYRVDPCVPQQSVISIGTTPYTSQNVGAVTTLTDSTPVSGTGYSAGTLDVTGGTGSGCTILVTVNAGVVQTATIVNGGAGYTVGDTLTLVGGNNDCTVEVATITPMIAADATCCKEFLCGETYHLRIDVKGSPTLRALNHNAYQTVDAYTGCCASDAPAPVDPTLVYIMWADRIIINNYLKDFVMPVVFDYTGVAWYAPGTTQDAAGNAVVPAQWWSAYPASVQALAWTEDVTPTAACSAGMRLYGAYVETRFGNCSFQLTDFFEREPVRIFASLVDYTGDPCVFEGLCVYHECDGVQGMGFGEQVIRNLVLSESYLQNFFHTDIRIREITEGDNVFNVITRTSLYYRYCILHSVPRFNNPTGVFDNDQYLLEIITTAESASFETFMATWLDSCTDCVSLEEETCNYCIIAPDLATTPANPN